MSRGQLLFRLDDQPYRTALAKIEAEIEIQRAEIRGLRAQWRTKREDIKAAQSQQNYAQADYERQKDLADRKFAPAAKIEESRMGARRGAPAHRLGGGGPAAHRGGAGRRSQDQGRRSSQGEADAGRARRGAAQPAPHHHRGADRRRRLQGAGAGQLRRHGRAVDRRGRRQRPVDRGQLQGDRAHARARRPAGHHHRRHLSRHASAPGR